MKHARSAVATIAFTTACSLFAPACGGSTAGNVPRGDCPATPIRATVTVSQWGDIVRALAGDCAAVTVVVTSNSADPHDFEPTPADNAAFAHAALVVTNGAGYDAWAGKAISAAGTHPSVVEAAHVVGARDGANPHLWYSPSNVHALVGAVSRALADALPGGAARYLAARRRALAPQLASYDGAVARVKAAAAGRSYAATEPVFDLMAASVGLDDRTPPGYRRAAANESEPGPADLASFERRIDGHDIDVLVYNPQTSGALPDQIRARARRAKIPVVEATETAESTDRDFFAWQVRQLAALAAALA